jgi:DNA-directed RNA polymerase specialized sigma24 family protein
MQTIDDYFTALRTGTIDAQTFFQGTDSLWLRLSRYLLRRFKSPVWVTEDELAQDLRMGAWKAVWDYEETMSNGRSLARYAEWHAVDKAKKRLHKYRGAKLSGNADANPSRFETPLSALGDDETTMEWLEGLAVTAATQLEDCARSELLRRIDKVFNNDGARYVARLLLDNGGNVEETAIGVFQDEVAMRRCRLTQREPREVGRFVATTAVAVAVLLQESA